MYALGTGLASAGQTAVWAVCYILTVETLEKLAIGVCLCVEILALVCGHPKPD